MDILTAYSGTDALDSLASLAASYGAQGGTGDGEDIEIGADVGEDLESDVDDEDDYVVGGPAGRASSRARQHGRRAREPSFDADALDALDDASETDTSESMVLDPSEAGDARAAEDLDLTSIFPGFRPGVVLNLTELLSAPPRKRPRLDMRPAKIKVPDVGEVPTATSTAERDGSAPRLTSRAIRLRSRDDRATTAPRSRGRHVDAAYDELVAAQALDSMRQHARAGRATWQLPSVQADMRAALALDAPLIVESAALHPQQVLPFRDPDLDDGEWTRAVLYTASQSADELVRLRIDASAAAALVDDADEDDIDALTAEHRRALVLGEVDPLNASNDAIYEAARETRSGVRQTLSSLEVQHAYVAKKLQLPFYKIQLSKSDARAFHRPALQFPVHLPITFTKTRSTRKKRDKVSGHRLRAGEDIMHNTADLSMRDTAPAVLLEYSEEYPLVMSNLGMGSIIVNYYRKKSERDDVPTHDFGETFVLEPSDETPFRKFGDVKRGEVVQALYNNLVRAPVFRHKPSTEDFLVVKVSGDGETRYYLREIKHLFLVGQTLPLKEVPGPHSRRLTSLTKARLMLIARRLCAKSGDGRCHIQQLLKYFDDHSPLQMRQRIKDFMEFQGSSSWAFKPSHLIPSELDNREVASPEEIVLYEAMQVGQRHLLDAGYGQAASAEGGNDDDSSVLDVEQQLAPWTTTKNFLMASTSKAMLALHGEGDPSARGEAFSFLRISMKDIFVPLGKDRQQEERNQRERGSKKYNVAEQQVVYNQEITRIWNAQLRALSDPVPPILTAEDEARARGTPADTPMAGMSPGPNDTPADDAGGDGARGKVLKIRRKVPGQILTERVKDPKVIKAYLQQRQLIQEENLAPEDITISADADENARNTAKLKKILATLKRNQQRRLQRRLAIVGGPGHLNGGVSAEAADAAETAANIKKAKQTTRVCGNCGLTGHMRTNKSCPRYYEFNAGGPAKKGKANAPLQGQPSGLGGLK